MLLLQKAVPRSSAVQIFQDLTSAVVAPKLPVVVVDIEVFKGPYPVGQVEPVQLAVASAVEIPTDVEVATQKLLCVFVGGKPLGKSAVPSAVLYL